MFLSRLNTLANATVILAGLAAFGYAIQTNLPKSGDVQPVYVIAGIILALIAAFTFKEFTK